MNSNINQFRRTMQSHENRRMDIERMKADTTVSSIRIPVNNAGEAIAPFIFACSYSQLPTMSFGYELQSAVPRGYIPLFTASVDSWYTKDRLPNSRLYTGAVLRIVSESVKGVSFVVTATATGIAFSGPLE